jgi:hypothetical protein
MELVKSLNLGLRFVLEMGALGAVGVWGFHLDKAAAVKWLAGIGLPVMIIIVWSMVVAPGTDNGLSATPKMWIGTAILGTAAVALAAARRPGLAAAFGVAILANAVLIQVWHQ